MAQVILFAGLLLACGELRRAAGAPSVLGPAAMSGLPNLSAIPARQPKEELELESLKTKVLTAPKPSGMKESVVVSIAKPSLMPAASPPANTEMSKKAQVPAKAPVNMEYPAPSDNNKENSEKKGAKQQNQQPSGFEKSPLLPPMEQRSTVGKNAGLLDAEQDYTPQDIAEYIFWTGDERRIALALNDFLQDQLVTKEDVARFLEDVKRDLSNLRNRYSAVNTFQNMGGAGFFFDQPQRNFVPQQRFFDVPSKKDMLEDWDRGSNNYNDAWSTVNPDKTFWSSAPNKIPSVISWPSTSSSSSSASAEENTVTDHEELFEKIREMDAKHREFSLQEIIYHLAKELFLQDELQGQPQRSIQRFAHFVENEADLGRIPKDLSKAVLGTLVTALIDAVGDEAKTAPKEQQPVALSTREKPRELKQKLEKLKSGAMYMSTKSDLVFVSSVW